MYVIKRAVVAAGMAACLSTWPAIAAAPDGCEHDRAAITQARGIIFEQPVLSTGQLYWKLVDAAWCTPEQGGLKINIFYKVKDQAGNFIVSQPCTAAYGQTEYTLYTKSLPDWGDFPMAGSNWCPSWPSGGNGPYSAWVQGYPSDKVIGMGLPCNYHESYYLTWQLTQATSPTSGEIRGTVLDQTGQPIANATITVNPGNVTASTSTTGQYSVPGLAAGTYSATAAKNGYASQTQNSVQVLLGQAVTANFTLTAGAAVVAGSVRDSNSAPIALASVKLSPGCLGTITNSDGSYSISSVPAGTYSVIAYAATKLEQTVVNVVVPTSGSATVNFTLAASGTVAQLWDDFNGNYITAGDTLEESFRFGFDNHEYWRGTGVGLTLPPYTGTNSSQEFEVTINNDQFVSYFQTKDPNTGDFWYNLVQYAQARGWPLIDLSKPINYIVYVKGRNMATDPNDSSKYWRSQLAVHYPSTNYATNRIDWNGLNAGFWQMLRVTTTGLRDSGTIWLTFESWYPPYYGASLNGQTSSMVFENLWVEYTPLDLGAPGPVSSFTAAGGATSLLLSWRNPADADFSGTRIRYRLDMYPTGPQDGTLLIDKNGSPGVDDTTVHNGLTLGQTVYYAAFAFDGSGNYSTRQTAVGTVLSTHPGDLDDDGDVDQTDFGLFQACFSGTNIPQGNSGCAGARLDADSDVDDADFSIFHACMNGPNRPPIANCAG